MFADRSFLIRRNELDPLRSHGQSRWPMNGVNAKIQRQTVMKCRTISLIVLTFQLLLVLPPIGRSQSDSGDPETDMAVLVQAVVCEDMQGQLPQNATSVFSVERRKVICFTAFDPVTSQTVVYHHWYHRDRPSATIKLTLKPPRWSTYSSIQLREEDIGPWRVEIADSQGRILEILRFSITE